MGTGSTALIARFIGAKEPDKANQVLRQSVLLGVLIGVVALVLGLSLARPAVMLLGARGEVVGLSSTYLRIVSGALILAPLMYLGNASLRGAGDTQTPLRIMMVVNAVNIVVAVTAINGLFGVPKMGVAGSALGAATAQVTGGVLVTAVLLRGRGQIRLRLDRPAARLGCDSPHYAGGTADRRGEPPVPDREYGLRYGVGVVGGGGLCGEPGGDQRLVAVVHAGLWLCRGGYDAGGPGAGGQGAQGGGTARLYVLLDGRGA